MLALTFIVTVSMSYAQQISSVEGGSRLSSGSAPIILVATLPPTLTLSVSDVNLSFDVTDTSKSSAMLAMPIKSAWSLNQSMSNVELVAYFDSEQKALSDGFDHVVPSDHVLGGLNEQTLLPFVETCRGGTAAAGRTLYSQTIGRMNVRGSRTDTLLIQLRSLADMGLPEGNYQGTLHLRLVAY